MEMLDTETPEVPTETPITPAPTPVLDPDRVAKILRAVSEAKQRSEQRRVTRAAVIRRNWDFVNGNQDWTHKIEGQSRIFLPDIPVFVEQIGGVVERRLTEFQNWFGVETPGGTDLLPAESIQGVLQHQLRRLYEHGDAPDSALSIETVIGDAIKMGVVEGDVTLKVYSIDDERVHYQLATKEGGSDLQAVVAALKALASPDGVTPEQASNAPENATYRRIGQTINRLVSKTSRLRVEIVPYEDFFPDMSGANLYTIHEVTQHISELYGNPDLDREAIQRLAKGAEDATARLAKAAREGVQNPTEDPWMIRLMEYWGDVVDPDTGEIMEKNVFLTVANGELLRPPTPNPFWHGRRPFISAPLLRTPLSKQSNAILDRAVDVAEAQNDLYSLMLDDAFSNVWGVRQYFPDLIENAAQAAKGIRWGFTARMKQGTPTEAEFLKRVDIGGTLHQFNGAEMMLRRLDASLKQALLVNDILVGQLPPRQVKATEIVEASAASDSLFDNMAARVERTIIKPMLELCWLTTLQYFENFQLPEILQIVGPDRASLLIQLTAPERFAVLANGVVFNVYGLREMGNRIKSFQKIMTMLNTVASIPPLLEVWDRKFSPKRTVEELVKGSGLDPKTIERRSDEQEPPLNLALMMHASGQPSQPAMAGAPTGGDVEAQFAEPNPTGDQGVTAGSGTLPV